MYGKPVTVRAERLSLAGQTGWAFWSMADARPLLDVVCREGQLVLQSVERDATVRWSLVVQSKGALVYVREVSWEPERPQGPDATADGRGHPSIRVTFSEHPRRGDACNGSIPVLRLLQAAQAGEEFVEVDDAKAS